LLGAIVRNLTDQKSAAAQSAHLDLLQDTSRAGGGLERNGKHLPGEVWIGRRRPVRLPGAIPRGNPRHVTQQPDESVKATKILDRFHGSALLASDGTSS